MEKVHQTSTSPRGNQDRSRPAVAIIIVNWNGWQDTVECLESLQRVTYPQYTVVVVDNGSTDGSVDKIKAWAHGHIAVESRFVEYNRCYKPVYLVEYDSQIAQAGGIPEEEALLNRVPPRSRLIMIRTGKNLGFAGGNNVGIRYALALGTDWILLLNNDAVVDPHFLEEMVAVAQTTPNVGIIGPKIYFYERPDIIQSVGARMNMWTGRGKLIGLGQRNYGQHDRIRTVDWVSGAAIMVRNEVFARVGLLDERFFICYEESDLCFRARRKGFEVIVVPTAKVWHKGARSTKRPIAEYYLTRNRPLFMRKNARFIHYFSFVMFYALGVLKRAGVCLLRNDKNAAVAILRGFKDGIRMLTARPSDDPVL